MNPKLEKTKQNLRVTSSTNSPSMKILDNFDPEILDFVVILNHLGFNTFSSCQGHIRTDLAEFCPYVLIENNDARYSDEIDIANLDKELLLNEYTKMLNIEHKLLEYLDEFYQNRTTLMRNRLTIKTYHYCRTAIVPYFFAFAGSVKSDKERINLNKIYLKEINDFTVFLESKISSPKN